MTAEMRDDMVAFWSGTLLSGIPAFQWLMQVDLAHPGDIAMVWLIKVLGTIILGFLGGLTGMFGKDFYRFIKRRLYDKQDSHFPGDSTSDSADRHP